MLVWIQLPILTAPVMYDVMESWWCRLKFVLCVPICTACAVVRVRERQEREKMMQEDHKERRIKTVMALKQDMEANEVQRLSCIICT